MAVFLGILVGGALEHRPAGGNPFPRRAADG